MMNVNRLEDHLLEFSTCGLNINWSAREFFISLSRSLVLSQEVHNADKRPASNTAEYFPAELKSLLQKMGILKRRTTRARNVPAINRNREVVAHPGP